jgi:hypothetical protein
MRGPLHERTPPLLVGGIESGRRILIYQMSSGRAALIFCGPLADTLDAGQRAAMLVFVRAARPATLRHERKGHD